MNVKIILNNETFLGTNIPEAICWLAARAAPGAQAPLAAPAAQASTKRRHPGADASRRKAEAKYAPEITPEQCTHVMRKIKDGDHPRAFARRYDISEEKAKRYFYWLSRHEFVKYDKTTFSYMIIKKTPPQ